MIPRSIVLHAAFLTAAGAFPDGAAADSAPAVEGITARLIAKPVPAVEVAGRTSLPPGCVLTMTVERIDIVSGSGPTAPLAESTSAPIESPDVRGLADLPGSLACGVYRVTASFELRNQPPEIRRAFLRRRLPTAATAEFGVGRAREWLEAGADVDRRGREGLAEARGLLEDLAAYAGRRQSEPRREEELRARATRFLEPRTGRVAPEGFLPEGERVLVEAVSRIHAAVPCAPADEEGRPIRPDGYDPAVAFESPVLRDALRDIPGLLDGVEPALARDRERLRAGLARTLLLRLRAIPSAGGPSAEAAEEIRADALAAGDAPAGNGPGGVPAAWFREAAAEAERAAAGGSTDAAGRIEALARRLAEATAGTGR